MQWIVTYGEETEIPISANTLEEAQKEADRLTDFREWTPVEWRRELLRGLMDTDGWVESRRCAYYTTTSPQLRDDVAKLARSLGCFVTITDKHPTYRHDGEKRQGRPAYSLRIKSPEPETLVCV